MANQNKSTSIASQRRMIASSIADSTTMQLSHRNFLSVVYSAIAFGIAVSPYVYLSSRVLTYFSPRLIIVLIFWILPCTFLLLTAAVSVSGLERRIRKKLKGAFQPAFVFLLLFASMSTLAVLSALTNYTLLEPVEYWHSLINVYFPIVAVTLVMLLSWKPTRLESTLTRVFNRKSPTSRILGTGILLALLAATLFALYKFHLFKQIRPV